ncbi:unnamed protein product [Anisakis simplex]|uniref:Mediator of RNA polymerase II transcription subunit 23 n=1 Tax=Anisakis simplex TaxID=6269 RepID=A0A0M3JBI3_ANISI|nr:unnamed protein product [Anisakis simplex]
MIVNGNDDSVQGDLSNSDSNSDGGINNMLFGQIARQSAYLKRILSNEVGEVLVAMADVLWCALEVQPKAEWLNACVKSLRVMISHPAVGYVTVLKLLDFYEMWNVICVSILIVRLFERNVRF